MNSLVQELDIQINDDVVFEFLEDTILEIYEGSDVEMDIPVEELWEKGESIHGTICDITPSFFGVQFGDGSFAFINRMDITVKSVNP